jgi:small subunit ribosomal protein S17
MTEETENNDVVEGPPAPDVAPAADVAPPAAPAAAPEPVLAPKERKQAARAAKAAQVPARGERSPEERQATRDAERAKKAAARRTERAQSRAKYKASEHERRPTPPREHGVGIQQIRQGVVVSDKADKTITVRLDIARRHRRYEKIVRTSSTVHAHDERNDAHIGDTVAVRESRPLSATKRWRLVEVVERAK